MDLDKLRYIVKVLEMIEDIPEGVSHAEINKVDPELTKYFSQLCVGSEDPYVKQHPDGGYKLRPRGVERLIQLREQLMNLEFQQKQVELSKKADKRNKVQNILTGIMIAAIVIVPLALFFISHNLQSDQLETFNSLATKQISALAPIDPNISLYIEPEERIIEAAQIARISIDEKGNKHRREVAVDVIIRNTGQMASGKLKILIDDTEIFIKDMTVPSLSGLSPYKNFTKIHLRSCNFGEDAPCNVSGVPLGKRDIAFEIRCPFCTPSSFNQTIDFCFWRDDSSICDYLTD